MHNINTFKATVEQHCKDIEQLYAQSNPKHMREIIKAEISRALREIIPKEIKKSVQEHIKEKGRTETSHSTGKKPEISLLETNCKPPRATSF